MVIPLLASDVFDLHELQGSGIAADDPGVPMVKIAGPEAIHDRGVPGAGYVHRRQAGAGGAA